MINEIEKHLKNLDCLVLLTDDLKKAAAFYQSLGFDCIRSDGKGVMLKLGAFEIHFHEKEEYALGFRKNLPTDLHHSKKGLGVLIQIEVDNAETYHTELLAKGLRPIESPEKMPWGNIEFGIQDPDGYTLCFYELPKAQ
ncbi:MAG: VOC family protein [Patescibacteria group bacterium]